MKGVLLTLSLFSSFTPCKDFLIHSFLIKEEEYNVFSYISIPYLEMNKDHIIRVGFIPRHPAYYGAVLEFNNTTYKSEIYYPTIFDKEIKITFNINKEDIILGENNINLIYVYNDAKLASYRYFVFNNDNNTYNIDDIDYKYDGKIYSIIYKNGKYNYYKESINFLGFDKKIYLDLPIIDFSTFILNSEVKFLFNSNSEIIVSSKYINNMFYNLENEKYFNISFDHINNNYILVSNDLFNFDIHSFKLTNESKSTFKSNKIYLSPIDKFHEIDMRFFIKNITRLNASFYIDLTFIADPYISLNGLGKYYVKVNNDESNQPFNNMKEVIING